MENLHAASYCVGGHMYRIFGDSAMHSKLCTDNTFLQKYVAESAAYPDLVALVDTDVVDQPGSKTFKWDAKGTKYFLEMYNERKYKFRDPKMKKKTLWIEMALGMNQAGYNVDEDMLDRKLRNMKKTYKTIKDKNNKNSTGRGRVTWEYFDVFEEIFSIEPTVNCDPLEFSMVMKNEVLEASVMSTSTSSFPSSPISPNEDEPLPKRKKTIAAKSMNSLFYMRKKMVEVEERKAVASEELIHILKETNKLMQERNELLRQFLETRSTKE